MPDLESLQRRLGEVLQEIIKQWPMDDPDERDDASRRVASIGAIRLVRSAIHEPDLSNESVSLWASDRPDLSYEALVLRHGWNELFSDEERLLAATRLAQARSKWENRPERQAKTWRDTWVFWIDGRPVGAAHTGTEDAARSSPTCEMFAEMAESFEESGQFGASFSQRRHYRTCTKCSALASLDEIVTCLDREEFRRLRVLLSMLPGRLNKPVPELWIFVLFSYIDQTIEVKPEDWIAARQGLADEALSHFVQNLDTFEFFGLLLAKRVAQVFQPAIPGFGELVLPAELGFPTDPGILNTSISTEEWNRLQEAEDEVGWGQKPGTGLFDDERFDAFNFMFLMIEATSFQILHWWKGDHPEVLTPSYLPDVDTLSEKLEHDEPNADTSAIQFAEASLRAALGDDVCSSLSRDANAWVDAVEAERRYKDPDLREGHGIVFHLVRAFERQLKQVVIRPFAEALKSAGAREFPWPIAKPLTKAYDLSLGEIAKFVEMNPTPELAEFLKANRLDLHRLAAHLPEIAQMRNRVSHGRPLTPDQGRKLRDSWFGIDRGDGGIFGILNPTPET